MVRPSEAILAARKLPPAAEADLLHDALVELQVALEVETNVTRRREALLAEADLLVALAEALGRCRRWTEVLARLDQAAERFVALVGPEDARTRHAQSLKVWALEFAGRPAAALALLDALQPGREAGGSAAWAGGFGATLHLRRAQLLQALGQADQAAEALESARALLLAPDLDALSHVDIVLRVAERLQAARRVEPARELLRHALAALDEIDARRRISVSARAPAHERARLEAALAYQGAGPP